MRAYSDEELSHLTNQELDDLEEQLNLEALEEEVELDEASAEFIDKLVGQLMVFTESFCDIEFFPYQTPIAYDIIKSIVLGDGEEKTLIATRQSGKSEVVSNVIASMMVILPKLAPIYPLWLDKFEKGFLVGVFAPTEEQADTVFGRVVSKLTSEHAESVLLDPEIDDYTTGGGNRGKGKIISLKNSGSICRMQTCNPKAKIESKTYHFAFIDEAQEADETMIKRSIKPMLAWNNGTLVLGGTARTYKCYFLEAIQHNKRRQLQGRTGKVHHHEYDWRTAAKYNKNYASYISKEKLRIGEDSDEFRQSYCSVAGTRLLTSDLQWVKVEDVDLTTRLLGFDEHPETKGAHRKYRHTEVQDLTTFQDDCSTISLDDGTQVTVTKDHQWLVQTAGRRTLWKRTDELTTNDRIWRAADVWEPLPNTYEVGYLRAAFDGEGCLTTSQGEITGIQFSQRDNGMLKEVKRCLDDLGFAYGLYNYVNSGSNGDVWTLTLLGGRKEALRFLAEVRPDRLLSKFGNLEGSMGGIGKSRSNESQHPRVISVVDAGNQTVYAIKTGTKTYIAEGLASHNCNEWLLDKGMFVSEDKLSRIYDPSMGIVPTWSTTPIVVGIDVARSTDSTVVTAVWVDWDRPDPFGFYEHRVLNWMELNNVEWETQYFEIIDFLRNYDIMRIGIDAQGVGGPFAERMQILLPHIEVIAVSSDAKAQNERWTHLMQLLQRNQLFAPGHSKARRLKRWKKFNQQMIDLERIDRGPYMLAAAPEARGAFDDYPDSLAIACQMTVQDVMPSVSVSESPFFR